MANSTVREIGNEPKTSKMNLLQAINSGLDIAMATDQRVICLGEDIGQFGGVFRATSNLQKKYGNQRCFNTPITEQGIVGFAFGLPRRISATAPTGAV